MRCVEVRYLFSSAICVFGGFVMRGSGFYSVAGIASYFVFGVVGSFLVCSWDARGYSWEVRGVQQFLSRIICLPSARGGPGALEAWVCRVLVRVHVHLGVLRAYSGCTRGVLVVYLCCSCVVLVLFSSCTCVVLVLFSCFTRVCIN